MIYVITIIGFGFFEQAPMPDESTCRVYQAENVSRGFNATCKWIRFVEV